MKITIIFRISFFFSFSNLARAEFFLWIFIPSQVINLFLKRWILGGRMREESRRNFILMQMNWRLRVVKNQILKESEWKVETLSTLVHQHQQIARQIPRCKQIRITDFIIKKKNLERVIPITATRSMQQKSFIVHSKS